MSRFGNEARGVCDDGEVKEFARSFFASWHRMFRLTDLVPVDKGGI